MRVARLIFGVGGRASRLAFWLTTLAAWAAFAALFNVVASVAGRDATLILYPPFLWVLVAASVRRLHDRDRAGGWLLAAVVPVLGVVWLVFELALRRGTPGENRFGRDPLEPDDDYLTVR